MKKALLLFSIVSVFYVSCKKDDPVNNNPQTITIRYDFTADTTAGYDFKLVTDTLIDYDSAVAQSWSKTITVTKASNAGTDTASITVFPPPEWVGTTIQANATVSISVNGTQKATNSAAIGGFDRPTGLTASTTY